MLFRYAEYDRPIIAVYEYSADRLEAICADARFSQVLLAPVDVDVLYNLLQRHLDLVQGVVARAAA